MTKFLAVLAAFTLPIAASATCTWTQNDFTMQSGTAVCTSASETALSGSTSTGKGWQVSKCPKGMYITVCTDSGQAVTAALTLSVFSFHPTAGLWAKWPDRNLTSEAITSTQRCQTFDALWTVVAEGKFAVIPTAGTIDGGNLTIYWACN